MQYSPCIHYINVIKSNIISKCMIDQKDQIGLAPIVTFPPLILYAGLLQFNAPELQAYVER